MTDHDNQVQNNYLLDRAMEERKRKQADEKQEQEQEDSYVSEPSYTSSSATYTDNLELVTPILRWIWLPYSIFRLINSTPAAFSFWLDPPSYLPTYPTLLGVFFILFYLVFCFIYIWFFLKKHTDDKVIYVLSIITFFIFVF